MSTILIADDEFEMAETIRFSLLTEGYSVDVVNDGHAAFEALSQENQGGYDLLITDIQMPIMTGSQLLVKLKEKGITVPVVVMTGFGDKSMVIDLMRNGCEDFIDKPFSIKELKTIVQRVLEKQKSFNESMSNERTKQDHEIEKYRDKFNEVRREFSLAKEAFSQIMTIDTRSIPFDLFYKYRAFAGMGGDVVCAGKLMGTSKVAILVADVAGHDIGASYHAILIRALFEEHRRISGEIIHFFKVLNESLINVGSEKMVTAQLIHIDTNSQTLSLGNAGHWPLIKVSQSAPPEYVTVDGDVIGIRGDAEFSEISIPIDSADRFFICTDGIVELKKTDIATGESKMLSIGGVSTLIEQSNQLSLQDQTDSVWNNALLFCEHRIFDDMLLVGFQSNGEKICIS